MSGLLMPSPNQDALQRRSEIVAALSAIVPGEGVIADDDGMRPFESDGLTAYRQMPLVVVLPETVDQVSRVLSYCHDNDIRVVPRGSGTSLSGGALPLEDGVLLGLSRFNEVLDIDYENRVAVVQPGVTNLAITKAVEGRGFYYAPDPSSQIACSIGGNIAENSGGVHCLKYGLTANNVLGIQMVLMNGEVIRLGGKHLDAEGYDLLGIMTGSEGSPRRRHRGDGQDFAVAGDRPGRTGRVPDQRRRRPVRGRYHRRGHYPGRHGNDGPAGDQGGGGLRQGRLPPRR